MDAPKPPLVIVNPASRGGAGARDWPGAAAALAAHFGPFERRVTEHPGHAAAIAREEALAGRRLLLTYGGDGTISETTQGILASGEPCALGVLPHGTGGDFIRSLALPTRIADAARGLADGRDVPIDVGRVSFGDGSSRYFINSASFGLSGEIASRVNLARKSTLSYAAHTAAAALGYDFPAVALTIDGAAPRRLRITTVSVHNGRYFGGGMKMAPEADLADGRLELVLVRKLSAAKLLSRAPLMYWGAHLGVREVEHGRIRSLEARPADPSRAVKVEVDGESPGFLPAAFELQPRALRLRLPRR